MSGFRTTDVSIGGLDGEVVNAVKCLNCGKVLHSKSVHDFRMCNCPNETFTDGGMDYQRYGGHKMELIAVYRDGKYINVDTGEEA